MLDIKFIRENTEQVKKGVAAKRFDPQIVEEVLLADRKKRELLVEAENLRAERNKLAKLGKETPEAKELKERMKMVEQELKKAEGEFENLITKIPNIPSSDVKEGKDENENEVLRTWGEKPKFDFTPLDYLTIGESLDIIDVQRAAKVSGARFGYLKGEAAMLEFVLVNLAMETLVKEGFVPIVPSVLIKKEMMKGMGYLEYGQDEMYVLDKDDLVLVGTSEQSIGPMHAGEVLPGEKLPIRYVSFSSCFRREAGSYGKDTKGILRVHQFDKVEMFSLVKPEFSDREHDYLLAMEEKLFQILEIHYQVIKMCSGDLGFPAARKYDLEAWMPGQDTYREVTSTSTCTDYQSRRLNIKYKEERGSSMPGEGVPGEAMPGKGVESGFVHTLNGTAFAIGRTIIAIIENYQQKDGSVLIPKALQKYTGFDVIFPKK